MGSNKVIVLTILLIIASFVLSLSYFLESKLNLQFFQIISNKQKLDMCEFSFYESHLLAPPNCTLQYLKKYATQCDRYPTMPFNQIRANATNMAPKGNYSCWFPKQHIRKETSALKCKIKKNISSIVILGDSNGGRYWYAMHRLLTSNRWKCITLKQEQPTENGLPDPKYFVKEPAIPLGDIHYRSRDCHGCLSSLCQCSFGGAQLTIEYIALEFLIDSEVTTTRKIASRCKGKFHYYCPHSDTYQEFIFREYLNNKYPDVLLFFTSMHDINRHTLKHIRVSANFFFNLVENYMPRDSYVIIMNGMKRQTMPFKATYENELTANEMQVLHNEIIYDTVHNRLTNPLLFWYVFPTLFDNSTSTNDLYADYVHRTPEWYTSISGYLLQLICVV